MRIETAGHVIEGHIIVGIIKHVFIGDREGMSRLTIDDEYDKQIRDVLIHTKIFAGLVGSDQARTNLEGARVILASRSYTINLGRKNEFQDVFELINVLSGQLAGHLLVFQSKAAR